MSESDNNKYILPPGFREYIAENAEREFWALNQLMKNFSRWSYRKISTSIAEYEESLFDGNGASLDSKTFRLVDPQTMKTLGIRSDITTQISRIIKSRLAHEEMPLRLCYNGSILRKEPTNTNGDRQLKQAGVELVTDKISARDDAEVIIIAIESLLEIGIKDLAIDLNTPGLIRNLGLNLSEEEKDLLSKKDINELPEQLANLVKSSGDAKTALDIDTSSFTEKAKTQIKLISDVYNEIVKTELPVNVTVDFVEDYGFEYHDMLGFSIFSKSSRDEIGRGGRYEIELPEGSDKKSLFASGFSLYLNSFVTSINVPEKPEIETVSHEVSYQEIKKLHAQGKYIKKTKS